MSQRKKPQKQREMPLARPAENAQWQPRQGLNPRYVLAGIFVVILAGFISILWLQFGDREKTLRKKIDNALRQSRYTDAEAGYARLAELKSGRISPQDLQDWATAALRADHPSVALRLMEQWSAKSPDKPEGWVIFLDLLRVLGQTDRMIELTEQIATNEIARRSPEVLMTATLGLLTDLDPALIRQRLARWEAAEPGESLAAAALLQRYNENPLPDDPSRDIRLQSAANLLQKYPESIDIRQALVEMQLTSGQFEEAGKLLQAWPTSAKNTAGYHRLQGRYLQDARQDYQNAIASFEMVIQKASYDWKTRYRLARALKAVGKEKEAAFESARMLEIREMLDPTRLEPIIRQAFPKGKSPEPAQIITLFNHIGFNSLARSWQTWFEMQLQLKSFRK
ncbi:MAG: tetratricopeptide repeat protein [bacterium]